MAGQPHRICPRTGTHWTDYGAFLGAEHIFSEMQRLDGRRYRPLLLQSLQPSDSMRDTDADAGNLLNLACPLPADTVAYPRIAFAPDEPPYFRPRVLVIADSFWWKIYKQHIHREVFAPASQFRYYNYEVFSDKWEGARLIFDFDLRQTLASADWVILCFNEGNAHRYPFDFLEQAGAIYLR
jgi:hypothetical protein